MWCQKKNNGSSIYYLYYNTFDYNTNKHLLASMKKMKTSRKFVKLIKITFYMDSKTQLLSSVLFNLTIEKVIREIKHERNYLQ